MPTGKSLPIGWAVPADPDGRSILARTRLKPATAGGVSVAAGAVDTQINAASSDATDDGYLLSLRLVCTVAPGAAGELKLKDKSGGAVLLRIPVSNTYAVGKEIAIDFVVPLQTDGADNFYVDTDANTGTWLWFPNGFFMRESLVNYGG